MVRPAGRFIHDGKSKRQAKSGAEVAEHGRKVAEARADAAKAATIKALGHKGPREAAAGATPTPGPVAETQRFDKPKGK